MVCETIDNERFVKQLLPGIKKELTILAKLLRRS
jgi:hypothetical protein